MFSEALSILDRNTAQYMIEEQNQKIEAQKKQIAENEKQLAMSNCERERLRKLLIANGIDPDTQA